MTPLVVDASVAMKWYVTEVGTPSAVRILENDQFELWAPDLIIAELGNILWKKLGRHEISDSQATEISTIIGDPQLFPVRLLSTQELIANALNLAKQYSRTVYDALYLAAALQLDGQLATADERLHNAVITDRPWDARLILVKES